MPSSAKMTMKRKRSRSRDAIDCIEFSKDATRFDRDRQYLITLNSAENGSHDEHSSNRSLNYHCEDRVSLLTLWLWRLSAVGHTAERIHRGAASPRFSSISSRWSSRRRRSNRSDWTARRSSPEKQKLNRTCFNGDSGLKGVEYTTSDTNAITILQGRLAWMLRQESSIPSEYLYSLKQQQY